MINTLRIFNELSQTMDTSSAKKIAEVIGLVYEELQNVVTKVEFNDLKGVVKELAEAQKRTETRIEELAESQRELAEAQKRTEEELKTLTITVRGMQKSLGGISNTIGYELEDKCYFLFPEVLKQDFEVEIDGFIERRFIIYPSGKEDEINIYGEGKRRGKKVFVIGEAKAQLGKNDIKEFTKVLKRVREYLGAEIIALFLCYSVHPNVENMVEREHPEIKIYKSYELLRRATVGKKLIVV